MSFSYQKMKLEKKTFIGQSITFRLSMKEVCFNIQMNDKNLDDITTCFWKT